MEGDALMEARFEPAKFVTSFDTEYATLYSNACEWHVSWTNTKIELTYLLSSGTYTGRMRVTGTRQATVNRQYPGHICNGSVTHLDTTFNIGTQAAGAGVSARVMTFDGSGDEYLTIVSGGLPGPGYPSAGFIAGQITLQYTGTGRSGSRTLPLVTVTRLTP
jgi:hypothetical protein